MWCQSQFIHPCIIKILRIWFPLSLASYFNQRCQKANSWCWSVEIELNWAKKSKCKRVARAAHDDAYMLMVIHSETAYAKIHLNGSVNETCLMYFVVLWTKQVYQSVNAALHVQARVKSHWIMMYFYNSRTWTYHPKMLEFLKLDILRNLISPKKTEGVIYNQGTPNYYCPIRRLYKFWGVDQHAAIQYIYTLMSFCRSSESL